MKTITPFLLGIIFTILISATALQNNLITVKPQKPISTVCFVAESMDNAQDKILTYSKNGFITKQISTVSSDSSMWYKVIVVMEKY